MLDIYKEEEVSRLANEIAKESSEKLKDILLDKFYEDISSYLYQHYQNNKQNVEGELIQSICEEYVKNPKDYKFANLREKMFLENKEEMIKTLTDEAIYKSVEDVIQKYTSRNYRFEWKWKDGIARFILENFSQFKDDERVNDWIGHRIKMKNDRINWLEEKLREVSKSVILEE